MGRHSDGDEETEKASNTETEKQEPTQRRAFIGLRVDLPLSIECASATQVYTVSQKNRTPATFCNNSNSPGSIAIDFDKNNR